jgi:hypothetical protein
MRTYDAPRDYRTALGPSWGSGTVREFPAGAVCGLSPVTLSAHLMRVLATNRRPDGRQDSYDDERSTKSVRSQDDQAAA